MINLNPINIYTYKFTRNSKPNQTSVNFCGIQPLAEDTFDSKKKPIALKIYNPFTRSFSSDEIIADLSQPQVFELTNNSRKIYKGEHIKVDYDPARCDFLYDKVNKKPIKTVILKTFNGSNGYGYNFMSEDLKQEYGYLSFSVYNNKTPSLMAFEELLEDRPKQGIVGPKLVVDYVQNWNDNKIGGLGHLADKLTVKYCLDNNLPVNIVSVADRGSHMAHYLRGKRFFPLEEGTHEYMFYKEKYGKTDINKILEEYLPKLKHNQKLKLDMGFLPMYMPQKLVQKYILELLAKR